MAAILINHYMEQGKDFVALAGPGEVCAGGPDYSVAGQHIAFLSQLATVTNAGISVYDEYLRRHIFVSGNFANLFGYDLGRIGRENTDYFDEHIHPDDLPVLERSGEAVARFLRIGDRRGELVQTKMINEYRLLVGEKYIRVIEQYQVLELMPGGDVWLSLSVLDVSPAQTSLERVVSKLMNYTTGEIYLLPEFGGACEPSVLSRREKDVLKLVGKGLYSKEISEQLMISVHTVNTHRQRILEKLNVDNSMEAVKYAAHHGLLE